MRCPVGTALRRRPQTEAAGGQHPQEVGVPDQDDVPALAVEVGVAKRHVDPLEHAVGALADLLRGLSGVLGRPLGHSVGPQVPLGPVPVDLGAGDALVRPVVPLVQVGLGVGGHQPGQLGRPPGPGQRAGQGERDPPLGQQRCDLAGLLLTGRRQRQIRPAGVFTGAAPAGLTVPYENQLSHDRPAFSRLSPRGGCTAGADGDVFVDVVQEVDVVLGLQPVTTSKDSRDGGPSV